MKGDEAIYYGDTLNDAIASHDAGLAFCLVGTPNAKDLREIKKISDIQIDGFNDLTMV